MPEAEFQASAMIHFQTSMKFVILDVEYPVMMGKVRMKSIGIRFSLIMLLALSGCSSDERWDGNVYPDRGKLLINHNSGEFKTLEECEAASLEMLTTLNGLQKGYYECGKNCTPGSIHMDCEENIRGNYYK